MRRSSPSLRTTDMTSSPPSTGNWRSARKRSGSSRTGRPRTATQSSPSCNQLRSRSYVVCDMHKDIRAAAIALLLSATTALAQEAPKESAKPVYRVTRLTDAIRVDGRLDESTYSAPPTFELAYE